MEILGVLATIVIVISFLQRTELNIRLFNLVGAILFVIYAITILSFSTALLNAILIVVQIYRIVQILKGRKYENQDGSVERTACQSSQGRG